MVALPSSLQNLSFGNMFNQPMEKLALPSSLQNLRFGDAFNHPMENTFFPRSLQRLEFGSRFNQPMEKATLPSGLQSVSFGHHLNQPMESAINSSSSHELTSGRKRKIEADLGEPPSGPPPSLPRPFPWHMPKTRRINDVLYHVAVLRADCVPGQLVLQCGDAWNCRGHWLDVCFWHVSGDELKPANMVKRGDTMDSLSVACALIDGKIVYLCAHTIIGFTYRMPHAFLHAWSKALCVHHCSLDVASHLRHMDSRRHCLQVMSKAEHDRANSKLGGSSRGRGKGKGSR
jgi:hypothetical protein